MNNLKKFSKYGIALLILVFLIAIGFSAITIIDSGTVGIIYKTGALSGDALQPGLHFTAPFITRVTKVNVQTQKVETDSSAASRDLQVISTTVAVNYHVDPNGAVELFRDVGSAYESTVIAPAIQESVKAAFAKYSAEELITKRQEVSVIIKEYLAEKFLKYHIFVDEFNIVNLDFSAEFNLAIEAKQTAQQQALKAEQDLNRIKIESRQQVEKAKAEAEATKAKAEAEAYAIEMVQEQLSKSENYIMYKQIEKWNGELPIIQGDSTPIIDMSSLNILNKSSNQKAQTQETTTPENPTP